jgi:hypothetical protein
MCKIKKYGEKFMTTVTKLRKSFSRLRDVIKTPEFQKSFIRGVLFSMPIVYILFANKKPAFAIDGLEYQKVQGIDNKEVLATIRKRSIFNAQTAGILAGVTVAATASYTVYRLYNENSFLSNSLKIAHTSLDIANANLESWRLSKSLCDYAFECKKCICN